MIEESGFVNVKIGGKVDTFADAEGEDKARAYDVYGYSFWAKKPE